MKYIFPFCWMTLWLFTGCELKPDKKPHRLVLQTVYAVSERKPDSAALRKPVSKDTSYIEFVFRAYDLVDLHTLDSSIRVDLRYADTNNFLGINLYDGLRKAWLNCETAMRVCAAQYYLKQSNPELSLLILDATRPRHIQQIMWDSLKMVPEKKFSYLSPPDETSLHNYGCAVDVTLINVVTGEELDMGTDYDSFMKLSQPVYELQYLKSGHLSDEAFNNRRLLRQVMKKGKMSPIYTEWWHFSMCNKVEAQKKFRLVE